MGSTIKLINTFIPLFIYDVICFSFEEMRECLKSYFFHKSLFILLVGVLQYSHGADYVIEDGFKNKVLSKELAYTQYAGSGNVAEVVRLLPDSMFKKTDAGFFNLGYFKKPFWFKTTLKNESNQTIFYFSVEQFFFDSLQLYVFHKNTCVDFPIQGIRLESPNRVSGSYFFPIHIPKGDSVDVVLKLSNGTGSLRAYFHVYSQGAYKTLLHELYAAPTKDAFFTGFLATVCLATFIFYLINRNLTYLFYSLFVLVNLINQLNLKGFLIPVWVATKDVFPRDFRVQIALLMYLFSLLYTRSFFRETSENKTIITLSNISFFGLLLSIVTSLIGVPESLLLQKMLLPPIIVVMFLTVVSNFLLIIEGVLKRHMPAYFFFMGYFILLLVASIYFLMQLELIPGGYFAGLWELGVLLEIVCLGVSLSLQTRAIRYKNKLLTQTLLTQQEEFINQTIELQEAERAKIARDLHDGLGQRLTGLKLNWFTLSKSIEGEDSRNFTKGLEEAIEEVRIISHQMLPKNLMKAGIVHAIEALCDSINAEKCKVKFTHSNVEISLQADFAIHLYRSTQECIHNAIRHGEASEIHIHLALVAHNLVLQIYDNGKGFEVNSKNFGFGLMNINNRVKSIKGIFSIESVKNSGTTVIIRIPYEKD